MLEQILVPLDGSLLATCVLPHTIALARTFNARVTLLQILEQDKTSDHFVDSLSWHLRKAETAAYLNEVRGRLQKVGVPVDHVLLEGPAATRITEYAHAHGVDLIVLSSHGQSGLSDWGISSVAQKIVQRANTSIMLVPAYQHSDSNQTGAQYRRILVPLDGSQRAEGGLPLATMLARYAQAKLVLAHVVARPRLFRRLPPAVEDTRLVDQLVERNLAEAASYLEQLQSRLPVESEAHLLTSDNVISTLHELVEQHDIDLVMLSAHGYSVEVQQPYGGLAPNFVAYGSTPLLIKQDLLPQQMKLSWAETAAKAQEGASTTRKVGYTHAPSS
ncbi:MAG TPA: universal stress protein [Anaerolineae bacterium]